MIQRMWETDPSKTDLFGSSAVYFPQRAFMIWHIGNVHAHLLHSIRWLAINETQTIYRRKYKRILYRHSRIVWVKTLVLKPCDGAHGNAWNLYWGLVAGLKLNVCHHFVVKSCYWHHIECYESFDFQELHSWRMLQIAVISLSKTRHFCCHIFIENMSCF